MSARSAVSARRGQAAYARLERRLAQVRQEPAPVRISFECPICGGDHPRSACDARRAAVEAAVSPAPSVQRAGVPELGRRRASRRRKVGPGVDGLDVDELRRLRACVLEELGRAVLAGAHRDEPDHLERVAGMLAAIDRRLRALDERDASPTLARRQLIASEA